MMRRVLLLFFTGISVLALSGCRSTLRYVEMDRTDQGMADGNMGYVYGPPPQEKVSAPNKRGVFELDVELPPVSEYKRYKAPKDEYVSREGVEEGNRGYVVGDSGEPSAAEKSKAQTAAGAQTAYTVEKGDSLSKLAKRFYGSPNKWRKIYEANKDKLKDPNKLRPGILLIIP